MCEVGPPRRVTIAWHSEGSSPAVSAGLRSSASSTKGSDTAGIPGSGMPCRWAMTRSRTSMRSVVRSAMTPPAVSNITTKRAVAAMTAWTAGVPLRMRSATSRVQARSVAMEAVTTRTSAACSVARRDLSKRESATAL